MDLSKCMNLLQQLEALLKKDKTQILLQLKKMQELVLPLHLK